MKETVAVYLNKEIIEKVPLFKDAEPHLIREIVRSLKPSIFTPGDYIVRAGEFGDEMFFISSGNVEVITADESITLATLGAGAFFGEMALLLRSARTASVRAASYCDLYMLDRSTFDKIVERYPKYKEEVRKMAEARRQENSAKHQKGS